MKMLVAGFDQDALMASSLDAKDAAILRRVIDSDFIVEHDEDWLNVLRISHTALRRRLMRIVSVGLLEEMTPMDRASVIIRTKKFSGMGLGSRICTWCRVFTVVLHEHHHPIPRVMGGNDTVAICPNCHNEFHSMLAFKSTDLLVRLDTRGIE